MYKLQREKKGKKTKIKSCGWGRQKKALEERTALVDGLVHFIKLSLTGHSGWNDVQWPFKQGF